MDGPRTDSLRFTLIGTLLPILAALSFVSSPAQAQSPTIEEIVVGFDIPRLLSQDIFVQYDGETVYLPLTETFRLLGFNVNTDLTEKRISGYMEDRSRKFLIDLIKFKLRAPNVERDLLRSEFFFDGRELYLRIDKFKTYFGIPMTFDFSLLRVLVPLDEDFPAFQKIKRQKAREKLRMTQESLQDVLHLPRERAIVGGGVLDWRLSTNPIGGGEQYFDLEFGGVVAGGDVDISGTGNTTTGFDFDRLDYKWHYYFGDGPYVTQAELGRFYTTGTLGRGFKGVSVTNRPQIQRKFFQTVNISGYAGKEYEVELYVDNRLVDFTDADASGNYNFDLDIFYGTSAVEVKFYGPNGEIRTEEHHVRIPFNLIPKDDVEYTIAIGEGTGINEGRTFAQVSGAYGLLSRVTIDAQSDIPLAPLPGETPKYAASATIQLASNLNISGSASPRNRYSGNLSFSQPSIINVGGGYTWFEQDPFTNPVGEVQRINLSVSAPLRFRNNYFGLRYYVAYDEFRNFNTVSMTYGLSASVDPVNINYLGQYKMSHLVSQNTNELSSRILASIKFHRRFRPQFLVDYDHSQGMLEKYGFFLTERVYRSSQITLSYERNELSETNNFMATLSFYTGFVDVSNRTRVSDNTVAMSQVQRGSVRFDHENKRVMFDRRAQVGYGSAVVKPFLDQNFNGVYDKNEEQLSGLRAKIAGVGGHPRGKDRIYYYDRLRAYDEYLVRIDEYSLDDPLLKPSNQNYRVTLNPNVVTTIEVPIVTGSELSGSVKRQLANGSAAVGGIKVNVVNVSRDVVTEITTFTDGQFFYLGLLPGNYRAYIDPEQLKSYGYRSEPESIDFEVRPIEGGEFIENVNFLLVPLTETEQAKN